MSVTVLNLQPGTTYHYRLVATNGGGTSYGQDQTFKTAEYGVSIVPDTDPDRVARVSSTPKRRATKPPVESKNTRNTEKQKSTPRSSTPQCICQGRNASAERRGPSALKSAREVCGLYRGRAVHLVRAPQTGILDRRDRVRYRRRRLFCSRLWFDLMFDVQVLGHRELELPEELLGSISADYRGGSTTARRWTGYRCR